jgi:hypothetical protein
VINSYRQPFSLLPNRKKFFIGGKSFHKASP